MAAKGKTSEKDDVKIICLNRKATHEYDLTDRLECGMILKGTEVKSLRDGQATLEGAFCRVDSGEVWLHQCEIPMHPSGNQLNHVPKRTRKLLLHKNEIDKFATKASERGFTLVPTKMYFKDGLAKIEIAVGRGKKLHDKREAAKKTQARREIRSELSRRRGK
jgi:SsrA-binding protein